MMKSPTDHVWVGPGSKSSIKAGRSKRRKKYSFYLGKGRKEKLMRLVRQRTRVHPAGSVGRATDQLKQGHMIRSAVF